jgi:hypothetical protein
VLIKGFVMKTLVISALSIFASAAMATGPAPSPEIMINGTSNQTVSLTSSSVGNTSSGTNSEAIQNLASNAGTVTINGTSNQTVSASGSNVTNWANGSDAYASQNISSNLGEVSVNNQNQTTSLAGSNVANSSTGSHSKAVQNVASNNACFTCLPGSTAQQSGGGPRH